MIARAGTGPGVGAGLGAGSGHHGVPALGEAAETFGTEGLHLADDFVERWDRDDNDAVGVTTSAQPLKVGLLHVVEHAADEVHPDGRVLGVLGVQAREERPDGKNRVADRDGNV